MQTIRTSKIIQQGFWKKKRHFKIPYKIYQSYERYARLLWIKLPNRKAKETLLIHVEMSWEVWLQ